MGFGIWELLCTQERVTEPLDHTKQMWKNGSRRGKMGIEKRESEIFAYYNKWVMNIWKFWGGRNSGVKGVIADMAVSEPKVVLRICTNPVGKDPKVWLAG